MTDERIIAAQKTFDANGNVIQLRIECESDRYLTYRFTAPEGDDSATAFDVTVAPNKFGQIGQFVRFSVRIDSTQGGFIVADLWSSSTPDLNEFTYTADLHDPARATIERYGVQGIEKPWKTMQLLAEAPSLRFQVPFRSGENVFSVDQTNANLRSVINSCL